MTATKSCPALLSLILTGAMLSAAARADTIIYMTDQPPVAASNMYKEHPITAIGTSGFFDVFVSTDVHIAGIALDIFETGPAIDLGDVTIHNFAGPRWGGITDGVVTAGPDSSVVSGFTIAIPGAGSNGMNPAAPDDGFVGAPVNAFNFARVSYNIVGVGFSQLFMQIGDNEIALLGDTVLRLGVGDAPIDPVAGARSQGVDGIIGVGIPEPASATLFGGALAGLMWVLSRGPKRKY